MGDIRILKCPSVDDADLDWEFGIPEAWSHQEAFDRAEEVRRAFHGRGETFLGWYEFGDAMVAAGFIRLEFLEGPKWDATPEV